MADSKGRSLGFWRCWALVVGGTIGSAIFMMPSVLVPFGGLGFLSWMAAAAGAMLVALTLGNVARRVTTTGGPYAFARAGFGDFGGFLIGWGYWIGLWTSCAAITIAFAGYVGALIPSVADSPVLKLGFALVMVWTFVGINIAGVRESGITSLVTTILKLVPLIFIGVVGLFFVETENLPAMNPGSASPVAVFASAFAVTFWSFVGIEAATVPSEDVIEPARNIPRSLVIGVLTVTAVYLLSTFATLGMIPGERLAVSGSPMADAGVRIAGSWGGVAVTIGALVSMAGAFNVTLLVAGQTGMAAARDGLFPGVFERMTKYGTPGMSYVIAGVLISVMVIMGQTKNLVGAYTFALLLATLTTVIPYAFTAMAGLVLSVHDVKAGRGRKTAEEVVAVLAFLVCVWVMAASGEEAVYWTFLLLMAGVPVYVVVTRKNHVQALRARPD